MQPSISVNPCWDLMVSKSSSPVDLSQFNESTLQEQIAFFWDHKDASNFVVDESNRACVERSLELCNQIRTYSYNCYRMVRALNATLPKRQHLSPVNIKPRDPKVLVLAMEPVFLEFRMDDTFPTTLGCKRFARSKPDEKYKASTMLQFVSLRFEGDQQQPLSIYGFVAVRDDCEPLRNYIFNLSRESAFSLSPVSSLLPLTSPIRGISVWHKALVEINLKAKCDGDTCDDVVLVDACIDFRWDRIKHDKVLKSRIDGPFGVLYMDYVFIKHGIEAVVEVDIPKHLVGSHVVIIARSSGFNGEVMIHDGVVTEDSSKVSAVIGASHGGNLYFGFLAMETRADGYIEFKVKMSGCQKQTLVASPQPTKSDSQRLHLTMKDGKQRRTIVLTKRELPFAVKKLGIPSSALPTIQVPFSVTFSTMGYYNCGA